MGYLNYNYIMLQPNSKFKVGAVMENPLFTDYYVIGIFPKIKQDMKRLFSLYWNKVLNGHIILIHYLACVQCIWYTKMYMYMYAFFASLHTLFVFYIKAVEWIKDSSSHKHLSNLLLATIYIQCTPMTLN